MTELPDEVVDEAVRLTRLARAAVDDQEAAAYRAERAERLADHGYEARVRSEDDDAILVCYPAEWLDDGVVDPAGIESLDRAIERRLSGTGDPDDWDSIYAHNHAVADTVRAEHGAVHGATAEAFADFMANHYARRIEAAGPRACREFLEEYLPRNAWPTDAQVDQARDSLQLVFEAADSEPPNGLDVEPV